MRLLGMDTCPSLNDIMEINSECINFNDRVGKVQKNYYFGAIFWNHDQEKKKYENWPIVCTKQKQGQKDASFRNGYMS
jgi:hypothetical protein